MSSLFLLDLVFVRINLISSTICFCDIGLEFKSYNKSTILKLNLFSLSTLVFLKASFSQENDSFS